MDFRAIELGQQQQQHGRDAHAGTAQSGRIQPDGRPADQPESAQVWNSQHSGAEQPEHGSRVGRNEEWKGGIADSTDQERAVLRRVALARPQQRLCNEQRTDLLLESAQWNASQTGLRCGREATQHQGIEHDERGYRIKEVLE